MNHEKPQIDTEAYLQRIKEKELTTTKEELLSALKRLEEPFKKKREGENSVELKVGKARLLVNHVKGVINERAAKKLTQLTFKEKGQEDLDILELLPENTQIFIGGSRFSSYEFGRTHSLASEEHTSHDVYLRSEIDSPYALLVMLHELGHVLDNQNLIDQGAEDKGAETTMSPHPDQDIAEKIRKERSANAFVLKVMRRYVTEKKMQEDILTMINADSLHTYYQAGQEELADREEHRKNKPSSH